MSSSITSSRVITPIAPPFAPGLFDTRAMWPNSMVSFMSHFIQILKIQKLTSSFLEEFQNIQATGVRCSFREWTELKVADRKFICGIVSYQLLDQEHANKVCLVICRTNWDPRVSSRQDLFCSITLMPRFSFDILSSLLFIHTLSTVFLSIISSMDMVKTSSIGVITWDTGFALRSNTEPIIS